MSRETPKNTGFVVAGHEALFEKKGAGPGASDADERCDACGEPIPPESEDDRYAVSGRGRYVWTRGEDRRAEEPPLCPSCAAAIGMIALHQFNAEDEG